MPDTSPRTQLAGFLAKYSPAIRALTRDALRKMRSRLPGAIQMVYDNYNALVIGFSPSMRPSDAIFSIVVYPRWVCLCFLYGVELDDPRGLLKGSGTRVRHIVLESAATLDDSDVRALIAQAIELAEPPFERTARSRLVIRSVSATHRSRRPAPSGSTQARRTTTRRNAR